VLIKACLNGSRRPGDHDALPLSPSALANDAHDCQEAGAGAVHIHPRGMGGRETLEADACAAAIEAIRDLCPGLPIGLTTGLWIVGDSARRQTLIKSWTVLPDFCSVNVAEPGTEQLWDLLLNKGIAVEAGLSSIADARVFVDSPFRERCLRVLIEIEPGGPDDPVKSAAAITRMLDAGGVKSPRLQHGLGACAWPVLRDALARGYDVRIGLEDTLTLRDNSHAAGNADLVASVAQLVSQTPARR
ncbi:MAG TPA: 3-keto-5-aminohexanoate cleavage protein, partial [Candidatus Dormibacteraeota bacterium]|nr:3-keto-5-aminohexanoate cleavage protein [Candidatus Dormibacteraeota bacterium]